MGTIRNLYTRTTVLEGSVHLVKGVWKMLKVFLISRYWKYNLHKSGKNLWIFPKVKIEFPKNISVGNNVRINHGSYLKSENPKAKILIKDDVDIGMYVKLDCSGGLEIGKKTVISSGARIHTHNHGLDPHSVPKYDKLTIGSNVWIADEAIILPQVSKIGNNSVVGARAVVTKNVPPNSVVAGNPTKLIKKK